MTRVPWCEVVPFTIDLGILGHEVVLMGWWLVKRVVITWFSGLQQSRQTTPEVSWVRTTPLLYPRLRPTKPLRRVLLTEAKTIVLGWTTCLSCLTLLGPETFVLKTVSLLLFLSTSIESGMFSREPQSPGEWQHPTFLGSLLVTYLPTMAPLPELATLIIAFWNRVWRQVVSCRRVLTVPLIRMKLYLLAYEEVLMFCLMRNV